MLHETSTFLKKWHQLVKPTSCYQTAKGNHVWSEGPLKIILSFHATFINFVYYYYYY